MNNKNVYVYMYVQYTNRVKPLKQDNKFKKTL